MTIYTYTHDSFPRGINCFWKNPNGLKLPDLIFISDGLIMHCYALCTIVTTLETVSLQCLNGLLRTHVRDLSGIYLIYVNQYILCTE